MINSIKINYSFSKNTFFLLLICNYVCFAQFKIKTGSENISEFISLIKNKNIGIVANNASIIFNGKKNIHIVISILMQLIHMILVILAKFLWVYRPASISKVQLEMRIRKQKILFMIRPER